MTFVGDGITLVHFTIHCNWVDPSPVFHRRASVNIPCFCPHLKGGAGFTKKSLLVMFYPPLLVSGCFFSAVDWKRVSTVYPCWPQFITLALSFTDPAMHCQHLILDSLVPHWTVLLSVLTVRTWIGTSGTRGQNPCCPYALTLKYFSYFHTFHT